VDLSSLLVQLTSHICGQTAVCAHRQVGFSNPMEVSTCWFTLYW